MISPGGPSAPPASFRSPEAEGAKNSMNGFGSSNRFRSEGIAILFFRRSCAAVNPCVLGLTRKVHLRSVPRYSIAWLLYSGGLSFQAPDCGPSGEQPRKLSLGVNVRALSGISVGRRRTFHHLDFKC